MDQNGKCRYQVVGRLSLVVIKEGSKLGKFLNKVHTSFDADIYPSLTPMLCPP